jgi:hypothetical protein
MPDGETPSRCRLAMWVRTGMSEMGHNERPVQLPDVPEGEEISSADAAERAEADPEEQRNRVDPVWSETAADDTGNEQPDGQATEAT